MFDAIEAFTSDAARCTGGESVGAIEPGRREGLVALGADPFADVSALRSVNAVYRGGDRVVGWSVRAIGAVRPPVVARSRPCRTR